MPRPILAIDPGATSGIAVFDDAGNLAHSVTIRHDAFLPSATVAYWLARYPGLSVVCEAQYAPRASANASESEQRTASAKAQSALVVAAIRGQWQGAAESLRVPFIAVHPSRWRAMLKFRPGTREFQKSQAVEVATARWNVTQTDAAEAACIGFAASHTGSLCDLKPSKKSAKPSKPKPPKGGVWP